MFSANKKLLFIVFIIFSLLGFLFYLNKPSASHMKKIAIANWGPHTSLDDTIRGIKDGLKMAGYNDDELHFEITDVNFDPALIGQMLAKLKAHNPAVLVALATPVAQRAKAEIKDIPVVFTDITDPIAAGLLDEEGKPEGNVTGVSDKQDLDAFIDFVMKVMPKAQRIGILFSTSEANDRALVKMMESAAAHHSMEVFAVPLDEARDIPIRMQQFRGKVDLIYVGTSGPIQPSLPAIVSEADRMKIPVFNADAEQVKRHHAFGAFAVSYYQVGLNTSKVISAILEGSAPSEIEPIYPSLETHIGIISKKKASELELIIPGHLPNTTIVE